MVVPDSWSAVEFAEAELADERVRRNLCLVTGRLERRMGISFSAAAGHDGRQAIGRWQRRSKNTVDGTLAGHFAATLRRCEGYPMVLIAMDTTVVDYPGHWGKTGLGPIDSVGAVQGLLAHTALAMSTSGVPLGTLDLYLWARDPAKHGQKHQRRQRLPEEKESWRWPAQVQRVQERLNAMIEALFIADREGDYFGLFSVPRRAKVHLLIRVAQNRE